MVSAANDADGWINWARDQRDQVQRQQTADADTLLLDEPPKPKPQPADSELMKAYFIGAGATDPSIAPKPQPCAYCRKPTIGSRITDGVRSFCDGGCEASVVTSR
jgi:hypothetical protein